MEGGEINARAHSTQLHNSREKNKTFITRESHLRILSKELFSHRNLTPAHAPANPMIFDKLTPIVNNLLIINFRQAAEREKSALSANCINSWQRKPPKSKGLERLIGFC
jgi:hypothetical protein